MTLTDEPRTVSHAGSDVLDAWTCAFGSDEPGGWGAHRHDQHQLIRTAAGSARVVAGGRSWVLPPTRALLVPGGTAHDVTLRVPAALHCLYVWPRARPLDWTTTTSVRVSPLLRELLVALGAAGEDHPVAAQVLAVVFHELAAHVVPDDGLVLPDDDRAARVAAHLLGAPDDDTPLADWGPAAARGEHAAPAARRGHRAFRRRYGTSPGAWRHS